MNDKPKRKRLVDDLSFWRDQEGQAMVEFVICAPILLFILISITWIYDYQDFHQDAIMEARRGKWQVVVAANNSQQGGTGSDQFGIPMLSQIGLNANMRQAHMLGSAFWPSMPSYGYPFVLAEGIFVVNGSVYETASLPVNNYLTGNDGAFGHTNPWNRILFALGGIFDDRSGVTTSPGWPPATSIQFPNERFPMVVNPWEAIRHKSHSWGNSYNLMEKRITGKGMGLTKGLEISSTLGYPAMLAWHIITVTRSPIYKFNEENFDYIRDGASAGLGGFFGGDLREMIPGLSDKEMGKNPLQSISSSSKVREVIRPGA